MEIYIRALPSESISLMLKDTEGCEEERNLCKEHTLIFNSPVSGETAIYGVRGGRGGLGLGGKEGRIMNCRVLDRIMVRERRKEWKERGQGMEGGKERGGGRARRA